MKQYIQFTTIESAKIEARSWRLSGYVALNGDVWEISEWDKNNKPIVFKGPIGLCGIDYTTEDHFVIFSLDEKLNELKEINI